MVCFFSVQMVILFGLFLLHVLSDLIVQSPMNNKNVHHNTITSKKTSTQPERTTAIPPARIAVLIQAKNKTKTNQKNPPKKVVWKSADGTLYSNEYSKINIAHSDSRPV